MAETHTIEYKSTWHDDYLKWVCGFANATGGTIYIGKNDKGEVSLFRPLDNHKRINISADRMCMPGIPQEYFLEGLKQLIQMDEAWIPTAAGSSLYIRPFIIGTDEFIGVKPSDTYRFYIFTSPSGIYYNKPVKVLVETSFIRAVEGGVGYVKASGNYGRSLFPTKLAQQRG